MKTYFSEIIPKLQDYSQKLDEEALLTNQHWTIFDDSSTRVVYIFRGNNELLISKNGNVEKGNWEYLGNNSLLIDQKDGSYLFNHGFVNDQVLFLKIDGRNEYAILLNENKIQKKINSLNDIYGLLKKDPKKTNEPKLKNVSRAKNTTKEEKEYRIVDNSLSNRTENIILAILGTIAFILFLSMILA